MRYPNIDSSLFIPSLFKTQFPEFNSDNGSSNFSLNLLIELM